MGITHTPTSSYYASGDGLSEISNQKLLHFLRAYTNRRSIYWDKFINLGTKVINKQINETSKFSPFFLLYGYSPVNEFERRLKIKEIDCEQDYQTMRREMSGTEDHSSDEDDDAYQEIAQKNTDTNNAWLNARAEAIKKY
jgi:hypothetical protein